MMNEELKRLLKENIINAILFVTYSLVLTNESKWGIEAILGGESIANVVIVIFFIILMLLCSYLKGLISKYYKLFMGIFNICVSINFESGDTICNDSTDTELEIKLNRYNLDNKTYDFRINVIPNGNLLLVKKAFSIIGSAKKLENIYLQLYWKPKNALKIISHKKYSSMTFFQGYPSIYFNCIVPNNKDKYNMKIYSTTDQVQSQVIWFELRKCCAKEAGFLCKFLFHFIKVDVNNAKGFVEIQDE
jgi:hypothetical protein